MTRVHVTYPDGETAEATYRGALPEIIGLMDSYLGCDAGRPEADEIDWYEDTADHDFGGEDG